jgi:hypothetical protein
MGWNGPVCVMLNFVYHTKFKITQGPTICSKVVMHLSYEITVTPPLASLEVALERTTSPLAAWVLDPETTMILPPVAYLLYTIYVCIPYRR